MNKTKTLKRTNGRMFSKSDVIFCDYCLKQLFYTAFSFGIYADPVLRPVSLWCWAITTWSCGEVCMRVLKYDFHNLAQNWLLHIFNHEMKSIMFCKTELSFFNIVLSSVVCCFCFFLSFLRMSIVVKPVKLSYIQLISLTCILSQ